MPDAPLLLAATILVNVAVTIGVLTYAYRLRRRRHEGMPTKVGYEATPSFARMSPQDDALNEVLAGRRAAYQYDRTIRIVCWTFIVACLVFISAADIWRESRAQIVAVLALAGIFVLVLHELLPSGALGAARFVLEGTAAFVFVSMLVALTGGATSPFLVVFLVVIGGAALVAAPWVTLILTAEAAAAYALAAATVPPGHDASETLACACINLLALALLSYAGMVIGGEQRRTRDAAITLSTIDHLTGLYNRHFFFGALDREIQRSRRFEREFCLLMMDLDGLKAINDRLGHYPGDLVLRGVADSIGGCLRAVDVAARYGGDEFVALLPETDRDGAFIVAEKIRAAVNELQIDIPDMETRASVSIGVVAFPDDGETADELMIAADAAMYRSKRLGKNRVVRFGEPEPEPERAEADTRAGLRVPGFRPAPQPAGVDPS